MPKVGRKTKDVLLRLAGSIIMKLRVRRKVTIVNYHNPSPEVFAAHMKLFSERFTFVDANYLVHKALPTKNPLLVTVDDGYIGNFYLKETIRKYNVPLMIYVVVKHIDTNRKYWFDVVDHSSDIMKNLKSISNEERKSLLKREFDYECENEFSERTVMNSKELKAMRSIGCSIGSHTLSHPILTQCRKNVAKDEIEKSKKLLSEKLGIEIEHFAYPNGTWNLEIASFVESTGYKTGRTISPGLFKQGNSLFQLPCYGISDTASPGKALLQATGFWSFSKRHLRKYSL